VSVTIRDVARRAGVSISTVSRVLNDTCPVQKDKRRLVLDAAQALGYTPNPAALSLLNKKTGGLGVLLPFVNGEFFSELLSGLDQAAQDNNLFLVVSTSHRRPVEFQKAMRVLDKRVDGLIVMAPELDAAGTASILKTKMPVVLINTYAEGLNVDVYNFNNLEGARDLTRHLLGLGHRRIGLIMGPTLSGDAQQRAEGYRLAMAEAGVADTSSLEVQGGFTREAGYAAAEAIAQMNPRPTAIVAANDYCAMGAISALHTLGIVVPDEIAVGGFDGLSSSQYSFPPLTTVRVPIREIGYRAVERLVSRLGDDGEARIEQYEVPVNLLVRESTAPLADQDADSGSVSIIARHS
jgi:LacI family transcriptional regulator